MTISRDLIRAVRRLDPYDLRRLQMLIRGLLMDEEPAGEEDPPGRVTLRQELVRCGKDNCRSCPHGPYWYAYWREDGRARSRYVGKTLPGEDLEGGSGQD